MGKELTLIGDTNIPVPEHIAALYRDTPGNLIPLSDRLPSLGIRGKVFSISADGETIQLTKTDSDGEEVPVSTLPVVIIDYAKVKGRSYRKVQAFDSDNPTPPDCWSVDSVTPDPSSTDMQAAACAKCAWSAKNSRVNDLGKGTVACAQHRILAIVPTRRLDIGPLRLRIPQTSDYDGRSKDLEQKNRFAFQNYLNFIKVRNVPHTQTVETKIQFDPNVDYPKLTFSPTTYLDPAILERIREMAESDLVKEILGDTAVLPMRGAKPAEIPGPKPAPVDDGKAAAAAAAAAEAQRKQQEAAAALQRQQEEAAAKQAEKERKAAEKAAKQAEKDAAEAAQAAASAAAGDAKPKINGSGLGGDDDDDDEDGGTIAAAPQPPPKPPKNGAAAKPSTKPTEAAEVKAPAELNSLLAKWGDDD